MNQSNINALFFLFRHLIRADSEEDYEQRLSSVVIRWPHAFTFYYTLHIHKEINKYGIWTMRAWDFPTTERSIITSNQCEHVNRLVKEQQNWVECPIDVAFHIGRDLQNAKVVEIARGLINTGNFALLPEYKTKNDVGTGEDLLRRIGSTLSYEQIIGKYKDERDVTRHAGAGMRRLVENHNVEIDGEEVDIEEIDFDVAGADLNTSVELQDIVRESAAAYLQISGRLSDSSETKTKPKS